MTRFRLSTYVEVVVPWHEGPHGYGVPIGTAAVRRAIDLARAIARPGLDSILIEQPPPNPVAFATDRTFGHRDLESFDTLLADALGNPQVLMGVQIPRVWVVNGCTITTQHPANELRGAELSLMMQVPIQSNEVVSLMVNEDRGGVALKPMGGGWEAALDGLTLRIWPIAVLDAIDYHDLYSPDAFDAPYLWVSSIGRNTCGIGTSLHASAPVLRPAYGGFADFFEYVASGVRRWAALSQALRKRHVRGILPWVITRTSALEGWVATPPSLAGASDDDLDAYLRSPGSLDAGWIDVRQRVLCDSDKRNIYSPMRPKEHRIKVQRIIRSDVGRMPLTVEVVQAQADDVKPWTWMRVSTDKGSKAYARAARINRDPAGHGVAAREE
ncbi:MAG: hypothetical protein CVT64_08225 [Actinobacteria bacterium HGW-Actinobacteria-4]|nr:MAG: hypothetical protein CVT64_08225 [Actinobacteria bacterium HGW-Actinobacteria-4]